MKQKVIIAIRNLHNFQVNRLEYLEEAMTQYGIYSANSIDKIVDAINQLQKTIFFIQILTGKI